MRVQWYIILLLVLKIIVAASKWSFYRWYASAYQSGQKNHSFSWTTVLIICYPLLANEYCKISSLHIAFPDVKVGCLERTCQSCLNCPYLLALHGPYVFLIQAFNDDTTPSGLLDLATNCYTQNVTKLRYIYIYNLLYYKILKLNNPIILILLMYSNHKASME